MFSMIKVLDHGFVKLDECMASDLSVVNSARVSFAQQQDAMDARGEGLINFLLREQHGTPFEHNSFRFHVRAPLFVVREWQRHRIGSFNEESGRYSQLERLFYVPDYVRTQVGKPGAYTFEPVGDVQAEITKSRLRRVAEHAFDEYEEMVAEGVAREVARMCLPLSTYSQFFWTVNARSLMNFVRLRNSPEAQYEIREYAAAVESFFAGEMPVTHSAFVAHGRKVP